MLIEQALRPIATNWPDLLWEDAATGQTHSRRTPPRRGLPAELFVYPDRNAKADCDRSGATTTNQNLMIHFVVGDHNLTIVTGDTPEPWVVELIDGLKELAGQIDRCCLPPAA